MANPFKMLGNGMMNNNPMGVMMNSFNQFRNAFTGDPKQKVQELLNSGQMSQDQYNQLQGMAKQFMQMMGK